MQGPQKNNVTPEDHLYLSQMTDVELFWKHALRLRHCHGASADQLTRNVTAPLKLNLRTSWLHAFIFHICGLCVENP